MTTPGRQNTVVRMTPQGDTAWLQEYDGEWGPTNVWLGISCEDQATADERIPLLLQTPAALRWVSYEPALAAVDVRRWLPRRCGCVEQFKGRECPACRGTGRIRLEGEALLDWIVVGGESGPGARPFDLAWARQTIAQCRASGTPVFFKQAGSLPTINGAPWKLWDRKGSDLSELPSEFQVRELPDGD